jgi:hypothetical protein
MSGSSRSLTHRHIPLQRTLIWIVTSGAIAFCVALLIGQWYRSVENNKSIGAMGWLHAKLRADLSQFYNTHGYYPSNLSELRLSTFDDGASALMLTNVNYDSDGDSFRLDWAMPNGRRIRLLSRAGKQEVDDWTIPVPE